MTPEAKVKAACIKILKQYGVYYFFPSTHGYGRSGVPDIICCYKGRFIAIECKAGKNKPTALQEKELKGIREMGGIALVISEQTAKNLWWLIATYMSYGGVVGDETKD